MQTQQRFVIDNTNPTCDQRNKYTKLSKESGFQVIGHYFRSKVDACLKRNKQRTNGVPDVAILSTAKRLERPTYAEGFDQLWYVRIENHGFIADESLVPPFKELLKQIKSHQEQVPEKVIQELATHCEPPTSGEGHSLIYSTGEKE